MLPAPSLNDVRSTLREKPAALIGLLFAPPFTKVGKETVVPRLVYLDERSGQFIHFFCAGYSGTDPMPGETGNDCEPICTVDQRPWFFGQKHYARFVGEVERETSWRYSGESELILLGPRFGFSGGPPDITYSQALVYEIEAMLKDGAIGSASELFEAVMRFARESNWSGNVSDLSDKEGVRLLGDTAAEMILAFLPKPARTIWKRGLHYRVQNLAR